jgi:hypothetical protein
VDLVAARRGGTAAAADEGNQPRDDSPVAKKNCLKPWRRVMWCLGKLTAEYQRRMYELLDLYARPLPSDELLICVDEKSKQLLAHSRPPLPMRPGTPPREDYEYKRHGTRNLFVAVEPRAGKGARLEYFPHLLLLV